MDIESLNGEVMAEILKLVSLMHNVDKELNVTTLNNVAEGNRGKFHNKGEDQKKKEELGTKTRTDKELEL